MTLLVSLVVLVVLLGSILVRAVRVARRSDSQQAAGLARVTALLTVIATTFAIHRLVNVVMGHDIGTMPALITETAIMGAASGVAIYVDRVLRRLTADLEQHHRVLSVLVDYQPTGMPDHAALAAVTLTAREREVVQLIAAGYTSDAAIAERLVISPATAATHVRNVLRKTGLSSRRQLLLLASELQAAS